MRRRAKSRAGVSAIGLLAMTGVVGLVLIGPGCTHPPEGLPVVTGLEQDDIPVKPGFDFVRSETYDPPVEQIGKFRSWTGWYEGRGNIEDIGPWYVNAMAAQGWDFAGRAEIAGPVFTYSFCKGEESASIEVSQIYKSVLGGPAKQIRAEIHPRGSESFTPEQIAEFEAADRATAAGRTAAAAGSAPGLGADPLAEPEVGQPGEDLDDTLIEDAIPAPAAGPLDIEAPEAAVGSAS